MFKVDLPLDTKQHAMILRRRQAEEERKHRIFNPRQRIIGVDEAALRDQVRERKCVEAEDRAIHDAIAAEMTRHDQICCLLQLRQQRDLHRANRELNDFRQKQQHKATRKEWDLSDPMALKNDTPARVSDTDPRCGVASLQMFAGEDLGFVERARMQKKEMDVWLTQQMEEKQNKQADEDRENRLYMLRQAEIEKKIEELDQLKLKTVRDSKIKQNTYNKQLSAMKAQQRDQEQKWELRQKQAELANNIHGDFLSENPQMANSCFGPHRVRVDYWKGMSDAQLHDIRMTQQKQREENASIRVKDAQQEELNGEYAISLDRMAELMARKQDRERRHVNRARVDFNQQLSKEQTERHRFRLINEHGEEYFAKFNTTSR